jgi:hypothetical protein
LLPFSLSIRWHAWHSRLEVLNFIVVFSRLRIKNPVLYWGMRLKLAADSLMFAGNSVRLVCDDPAMTMTRHLFPQIYRPGRSGLKM